MSLDPALTRSILAFRDIAMPFQVGLLGRATWKIRSIVICRDRRIVGNIWCVGAGEPSYWTQTWHPHMVD